MRNRLILCGGALLVAVACRRSTSVIPTGGTSASAATPSASSTAPSAPSNRAPPRGREAFVGSGACAPCHRAQSDAYLGSHHAKALVAPGTELEKTRFDGGYFTSRLGGKTKFTLRDGAPVVTTPIPDGKSETFPVAYVSGVWPLEQYVVATERGKLQSLGVVWDSRSAAEKGSRWFHVYGADGIAPQDPLFFAAPAQNWNHVCADCHSTLVERRYDPAADRFDSRWAELSVGCEACHGPGAEHVRAAKAGNARAALFAARLTPAEPWSPSSTGSPIPRNQDGIEVEVCAPCHSRREPLKEGFLASDPFLDFFEPELLRPGRYHADGQVEGEVYEWASFLQSRMYQAGVRCSDCHEPHSGSLRAQGNALCVRCHEPARFDVPTHSHHAGASAPRCVDCHMPPATFMQIDERRDHSVRVPRPDLSVQFGTPNACNGCHTKKSPTWAQGTLAGWFPLMTERPHFAAALAADRQGTLEAGRALRALVEDLAAPAVARATALEGLGRYPTERTLEILRAALASPVPLLAYGAVLGAAELPATQRVPVLVPALEHPLRAVRMVAAKALAGAPLTILSANARSALMRAFAEVEQSFDLAASRPETHVERSAFELARDQVEQARASLRTALRLRPCLAEAYLNLADLERQGGDEAAAARAIRAALECAPKNAAAHHALGLWQVRAHQTTAAITSLKRAVELAPRDARFAYVLAVALADNGEQKAAIGVLETSLLHRPNDLGALRALAGSLRDVGQSERAAEVRRRIETLLRP